MSRPRKIKAIYDANAITVYLLCTPKEADRAIRDNSFTHLSNQKQVWIQPSFIWSTVRSGFGQKMKVMRLDIAKEGFLWALEHSCLATFQSNPVHPTKKDWEEQRKKALFTAQWDADLDLDGRALQYDCLRLGFTGEMFVRYAQDWVVNIQDMSKQVHVIWDVLGHGVDVNDDQLPREEDYPIYSSRIATVIKPTL
ncbi:unnamed protein product [Penicillium glandicola]